jgi:hypothetical protein
VAHACSSPAIALPWVLWASVRTLGPGRRLRSVSVHRIAGSDHRTVVAELVLPAS